jgi:hypothetical protein
MIWYQWLAVASLLICTGNCLYHFFRLVRLGKPQDFSNKNGDIPAAIRYSFTGAMSPMKKESAFMHIPTYTAGMIYHLGTFLSIVLFFLLLLNVEMAGWLRYILTGCLLVTAVSGAGILVKRALLKKMRSLSNPDDYIANSLVTALHFLTAAALLFPEVHPVYFITMSVLLLYIPVSKLKHLVYFFAARYQLAQFFGWRNVWPPKKA